MTRLNKLLFAFGLSILTATIAQAQLTNGGFETGTFPPWTTTGTDTVTGEFPSSPGQAPAEGNFQAAITTPDSGTVAQFDLETFLELSPGTLEPLRNFGPGLAGGSAIKQTFTVQEGQAIAFSWDFLPNGASSINGEKDSGLFTLHRAGSPSSSFTVLSDTATSGGTPTGYRRFGTVQLSAGTYLLGFSAFDSVGTGNNDQRPDLLIDNVQVFSCTPPPSGMIAWWPGDSNAKDIAGIHDGTFHGNAASGAGKVGNGFVFDGTGDYVDGGDVDLPVTFTIDAWINPTTIANFPLIVAKDDGFGRTFQFQIDSGRLRAHVFNTTAQETEYFSTTLPVTTGTWQHVAVSYDGNAAAGAKFKFYYNGAEIAAQVVVDNGGVPANTTTPVTIGIFGTLSNSNAFTGGIDELEMFNRVLSGSEIQAIYNADAAGKCKPVIYVTNSGNSSIEQFDSSGTPSVFSLVGSNVPQGLAFDAGYANLYVASNGNGGIEKYDSNGNNTNFVPAAGNSQPYGVAFDRGGNLYVANFNINQIKKFDPAGAATTFANTDLSLPVGLAFNGAGNLYVSNFGNGTIEKFDPQGNSSPVADGFPPNEVTGIAFDKDGNLFVAGQVSNAIFKIDTSDAVTEFADSTDGINNPFGLAFDEFGNLFVLNKVNTASPEILKFDSAGNHVTFAGSTGLSVPGFIAIKPGNVPLPAPTPVNRRFVNISSRASVGTGDNVAIAGFIPRSGEPTNLPHTNSLLHPKRVLIRGLGPSLNVLGTPVPGSLADPVLELRDGNHVLLASNDNWRVPAQNETDVQATGLAPTDDNEAAIVITLESDAPYTAILSGAGNTTGIGLIEVYDLDSLSETHLANISTRAQVLTGDDVLIGGVIIRGGDDRQILFRALGPSLAAAGVSGVLADPQLDIRDAQGTTIVFNDDWASGGQAVEIGATGLAPTNTLESAILFNNQDAAHTLPPGNYTAIVNGNSGGTGVGLVEAYRLGPLPPP